MEILVLLIVGIAFCACEADRTGSGPSNAYLKMEQKQRETLAERIHRHRDDTGFSAFKKECFEEYRNGLDELPKMSPPYKNRYDFECQENRQTAPMRRMESKLEYWLDEHYPEEASPSSMYSMGVRHGFHPRRESQIRA